MTASKAWIGAIYAAIAAGLSALAVVLVGDSTLADVTIGQWISEAIAVVTAFGGAFGLVYQTTNSVKVTNGGAE